MNRLLQEYANVLTEGTEKIVFHFISSYNGTISGNVVEEYYKGVNVKLKADVQLYPDKGYAFDYFIDNKGDKYFNVEEIKNKTFDKSTTFTAYFSEDKIGRVDSTNNVNHPDGIPDKYQIKVCFEVFGGTASFETNVVTMYKQGQLSEDGVGYLAQEDLPRCIANTGYDQDSLTWSPSPIDEEIRNEMTFIITFAPSSIVPEPVPEPITGPS